ncbi:MAG: phosphonate ABC transporter, permease protein PhnE [Sphingomonadaceae bacterium]
MTTDLALTDALRINRQAVHPPLWDTFKYWALFAAVFAAFLYAVDDIGLGFGILSAGVSKLGVMLGAMWPPSDGEAPVRIWFAVAQTLGMAVLGTSFAALMAVPLGLIAARNIVANPVVHFVVRRVMDVFRGIPALIWALILVAALGLGPIAGILALAFADIPRLGKLFAEAMENIDERQRDSIRATGASAAIVVRFGTLPQALPIWLSQCLYSLEMNFRAAVVVGVVGGGGIGFELQERIRIFAYDEVAYIIILYVVTVSLLDLLSERLRANLL